MAPPASRNSGSGGGGGSGTGVSSGGWGDAPLARALFAYLSSGENQLSFLEGDLIALMGEWWLDASFGIIPRPRSTVELFVCTITSNYYDTIETAVKQICEIFPEFKVACFGFQSLKFQVFRGENFGDSMCWKYDVELIWESRVKVSGEMELKDRFFFFIVIKISEKFLFSKAY